MPTPNITVSQDLDELITRFSHDNDCSLIIHCLSGKMQMEINDISYIIGPEDMILCRPELIIGKYLRSPDMKCNVIVIPKNALDDIFFMCLRADNKWWEKSNYMLQHPVMHLDERQQEICRLFMRYFEINRNKHTDKSMRIRRIFIQAAIFELLNWMEENIEPYEEKEYKQGRQEIIFRDFIHLLQETQGRQREVQWFAAQLALSPKYLSVVCHSVARKSAQAIINDYAVREIKRLLRQTDMSIKEVCVEMNFPSLSFFCKYVKHHLGVTANHYRIAANP